MTHLRTSGAIAIACLALLASTAAAGEAPPALPDAPAALQPAAHGGDGANKTTRTNETPPTNDTPPRNATPVAPVLSPERQHVSGGMGETLRFELVVTNPGEHRMRVTLTHRQPLTWSVALDPAFVDLEPNAGATVHGAIRALPRPTGEGGAVLIRASAGSGASDTAIVSACFRGIVPGVCDGPNGTRPPTNDTSGNVTRPPSNETPENGTRPPTNETSGNVTRAPANETFENGTRPPGDGEEGASHPRHGTSEPRAPPRAVEARARVGGGHVVAVAEVWI